MYCLSLVDLSHSKNGVGSCHPAKHQCSVLCLISPISWFIGQKPASKNCMQERSQSTFIGKHAWNGALVQQKVFHLLFFSFLIHFPRVFSGPFTTRHTNPCHNSLRVILSVPADEKKHYAIWSRSSRSFITQSRITEKLCTTFPLLLQRVYNYIMQIFYAFLCILFFFTLPNCF